MPRLVETWRPRSLTEVVGQPSVRKLAAFARDPYASCWLLVGEAGVGKSCAARALAADLGSTDDMSGLMIRVANLGVEEAKDIVRQLQLRPMLDQWNVLILEELERLSQQCTCYLKVALASENLPRRAIVMATSNDSSGIDPALLERFGRPLIFDSRQTLAEGGAARIAEIWESETHGSPLPNHWRNWGFSNGALGGRYSLRAAIEAMQQELLEREVDHVRAA